MNRDLLVDALMKLNLHGSASVKMKFKANKIMKKVEWTLIYGIWWKNQEKQGTTKWQSILRGLKINDFFIILPISIK